MKDLLNKRIQNLKVNFINFNCENHEKWNTNCSAGYSHKERKYPLNKVELYPNIIKKLSFDGEVDRIIYYILIKK